QRQRRRVVGGREQGGAQPAGQAGRAGDEVDGEPGDGVPQRLRGAGGEPLPGAEPGPGRGPGPAACGTPRAVTAVAVVVRVAGLLVVIAWLTGVGAVEGDAGRGQREGDDLVDHPHVRVRGDHRLG